MIDWLEGRKSAGKYVPGVYLCWELMVGNSNCRWYWGTKHGTPEPTIPWCGLLWPDATPVSLAEAHAVRLYATGKSDALFFDSFQDIPKTPVRAGWTRYSDSKPSDSRVLTLKPNVKMIVGRRGWSDYILEAVVMLEGEGGNAGLVFRVNDPGPGVDQMRGYYVGLDTNTLYLSKLENNLQPLASFDLSELECNIRPGVWNQIRIAAEGPRIRVWLNRMHHEEDGLRIDYTDTRLPILRGTVGVRTRGVEANFDNLIVMPTDAVE